MAERLRGLPKAELVETAMRVRKELLSKCRGELRALELRRKREERGIEGPYLATPATDRFAASLSL